MSMSLEDKKKHNVRESNLTQTFDTVARLARESRDWDKADAWRWVRNYQCKYISIRIDMRDGGHIIMDRDGTRIDLETLLRQR